MKQLSHRSLAIIYASLAIACGSNDSTAGDTGTAGNQNSAAGNSSAGSSSTGGSSASSAGASGSSASSAAGTSNGASGSGTSGSSGASGGSNPGATTCKRGIAYGHHSKADLTVLAPSVAWWYNWAYLPDEALRDGSYKDLNIEYVPMTWNSSFDSSQLQKEIPTGTYALLGFNEPNFGEQANMSAAESAAAWPQVEAIADERGLTLVSPAVNFCGGDCQETDPWKYLDDFFAACKDCRVDKVAFHIYVGCNQTGENKAQWLINHVESYKARFSQPLWLTEFACTDAKDEAEQIAFLKDALVYLEAEPRIERYAWFSGRFEWIPHIDLLGADGVLTALGKAYVDAPHESCQR